MPQTLDNMGVVNLALALIGQQPIPTSDTNWTTTVGGVRAKAVFETARLTTLRDHTWKFARRRIELTAVETDEYDGFDYIWAYPDDTHFIRKVYVDTTAPNPDPVEFAQFNGETSGDNLLATNDADEDGKCYAETTYTGGAVTTWDPIAIHAFSCQLAYLLAVPLTGKAAEAERMARMYQQAIDRAKSVDAREERILSTRKKQSDFLTARA